MPPEQPTGKTRRQEQKDDEQLFLELNLNDPEPIHYDPMELEI